MLREVDVLQDPAVRSGDITYIQHCQVHIVSYLSFKLSSHPVIPIVLSCLKIINLVDNINYNNNNSLWNYLCVHKWGWNNNNEGKYQEALFCGFSLIAGLPRCKGENFSECIPGVQAPQSQLLSVHRCDFVLPPVHRPKICLCIRSKEKFPFS